MTKARLLACRGQGSGSWLHALPSANLGLRLNNDETRIAVGLRLDVPLVLEHSCVCGSKVESAGHHGLAAKVPAVIYDTLWPTMSLLGHCVVQILQPF